MFYKNLPHLIWIPIIAFPFVFPESYFISVLTFVGIWAIMLIGFDVLVGYCGQLSLGHNAFFAIGAYANGILSVKYGFNNFFLSLGLGAGISLVTAWIIGVPCLRLKGYYLAIATLGFGLIINNFIVGLNTYTGGASGLHFIPPLTFGSVILKTDFQYYFFVWCFVIVALLLTLNLTSSRLGRALRGIHEEELFASSLRIQVSKLKIQAFMYSAVCASVAGSLYSHFSGTITPESFNFMISIQMVIMLFLGGRGTVWGAIVGTLFFKLLSEWLTAFQEYELPIFASIFIIVLIFFPKGLVGGLRDTIEIKRNANLRIA